MKILSALALLLTATTIAACGGGSGGVGRDPLPSNSRPSFDQITDRGEYLTERFSAMTITDVRSMPNSGTASYLGVAGFVPTGAGSVLQGVASMTADFGRASFSGTLTDFRNDDNRRVPGRMNLRNGSITGNEVNADLRGNLVISGQDQRVTGLMNGAFGGPRANAMVGSMEMRVGGRDYVGVLLGE